MGWKIVAIDLALWTIQSINQFCRAPIAKQTNRGQKPVLVHKR